MNKFKLGQKVKAVCAIDSEGHIMNDLSGSLREVVGTVQTIIETKEPDSHGYQYKLSGAERGWWKDEELESVGKAYKPSFPKFLLSKGMRETPMELESEIEVKKAIKKITMESESYDSSFKVYSIKSVKTIVLEDTVIIKGLN